jgi:hypothetical protein
MYTPYMTVYLVISLQEIPDMHRIYIIYIWFWPTLRMPYGTLCVYSFLAGKSPNIAVYLNNSGQPYISQARAFLVWAIMWALPSI